MSSILNLNGTNPPPNDGQELGIWQRSATPTGIDPSTGNPYYDTSVQTPNSGGVAAKTANYSATLADNGTLLSFSSAGAVTMTLIGAWSSGTYSLGYEILDPAGHIQKVTTAGTTGGSIPTFNDTGGTTTDSGVTWTDFGPFSKWRIAVQNVGAGTLTISPNGLNIDGAAGSLAVATATGIAIYSDGSNYFTERGIGPGSLPPSGAAGGDLGGSYPDPTVDQVNGAVVPASAAFAGTNSGRQIVAASGAANLVAATPSGSSGAASLRALVPADLPVATTSALGAVKPDGSTITISAGVISATGGSSSGTVTQPILRGVSNAAGGSSTLAVSFPSGSGAGDLALLGLGVNGTTTTPSGWTLLTSQAGLSWNGYTFSKTLSAADITAGGVTVTLSGAVAAAAQLATFVSGTAAVREFHDAQQLQSVGLTITLTTSTNVLASDYGWYFGSNSLIFGTISETISRGTTQTTSGGSDYIAASALEALSASGSYSIVFTSSNGLTDFGHYASAVILEGLPVSAGNIQQETFIYGEDTGTANAYAVALYPAPTIAAGSTACFIAANANTGASTLAVNGGTPVAIKKNGNSTALGSGDIAQFQIVRLTSDGTVWQMISPGIGLTNPMTTVGDIIVGGTSGTPTRLAAGSTSGYVLTSNGSAAAPSWQAGGGGGGALFLLEEHTASSSAALDFTSWYSSAYDDYIIRFVNLVPATNGATAQILCSTNGGSSYDTGANYGCIDYYFYSAASGQAGASSNTANAMSIIDSISRSANYGLCASLDFFSPGNTISYKQFIGRATWFHSSVGSSFYSTTGGVYRNAAAVNALRVQFSSGNIASGTVRIYGLTH